jgi:hypothetical protein
MTDTNTADIATTIPTLPADENGNTIGQDGKAWPQTFDGMAWAIEFNKRFEGVPTGDALGWMANALMRGFDEAHSRLSPLLYNKRTHATTVAGALFDFLGFLTTHTPPITLVASEPSPQALDLLQRFALSRELSLDDASVMDWQEHLHPEGKPGHVAVLKFDDEGGAHFTFNQTIQVNSTTKFLVYVAPLEQPSEAVSEVAGSES